MEIYELYSDECNYNVWNYWSIWVISGKQSSLQFLKDELDELLKHYKKQCIEYKKINGDSTKEKLAIKFVIQTLEHCVKWDVRIDILTWNNSDTRNWIRWRDNIANLIRMYYRIITYSIENWKWETIEWDFYPDEHTAINWKTDVIEHIENTNLSRRNKFENTIFWKLKNFHYPKINNHNEIKSHENTLLQIIDVYTGLCNFSFLNWEDFIKWKDHSDRKKLSQLTMPDFDEKLDFSKWNLSKFRLLDIFLEKCKKDKLWISINTNKYLNTPDKWRLSNINFWPYIPQHENDKAPLK